jgi:RNA polymerase sigma-70 factor (ECF subfamily)
VSTDLLARARAGDGDAFGQLTDPYRRELHVHCYRILGSLHDADDALQETMLTAWRSLDAFEGRASLRTWLYRVATSRCLNSLRSRRRHPAMRWPVPDVQPPEPTRLGEVHWLEPFPDSLFEAPAHVGPDARYEATEAISLAFITALQLLPPRQRAVVILRDVLGFHADEVATMLDSTVESVTSALKRGRVTLQRKASLARNQHDKSPAPSSLEERALVERLTWAYEAGDVNALVAMLTDDVLMTMPPVPLEYQGRELAAAFNSVVTFRGGRRYRLVPTRANGQLAFGAYLVDPATGIGHAMGLLVITLRGSEISALARFDSEVQARIGLPRTLPPS